MGCHVDCYFALSLGEHSETSWQVRPLLWSIFLLISIHHLYILRVNMYSGNREPPNMYGLEISEKSAFEVANLMRGLAEEVVRWMFHVTAEREWFVFAQVVAGLLLFSYVGTLTDLLTLLYTGISLIILLLLIIPTQTSKDRKTHFHYTFIIKISILLQVLWSEWQFQCYMESVEIK